MNFLKTEKMEEGCVKSNRERARSSGTLWPGWQMEWRECNVHADGERGNCHRRDETPGSELQQVSTRATRERLVSTGNSGSSKLFYLFYQCCMRECCAF